MKNRNNYAIQAQNAKAMFKTYDQEGIIRKFDLAHDETWLYARLLGRDYRICRATGDMEKQVQGVWADGNGYEEVMTLMDLLCDAKPDRFLTGRWRSMQSFGLQFHQNLLENEKDPAAERYDRDPESLRRGCLALGGVPLSGGDISYAVELFDGLSIAVQFWRGDEEFAPRLRYFWDENALQFLRYETMYFAVALLLDRLAEAY